MNGKRKRNQDPFNRTLELSTNTTSLATRMKGSNRLTHCLVIMRGLDVGSVIRLEKPVVDIGRDQSCDVILTDEGISRRHARFTKTGSNYSIQDLGSTNGIYINGMTVETSILTEGDKILLGRFTILKYTQQDELELEFQKRIHESASLDGLTGALNRRSLEARLNAEWSFAKRHGTNLSIIMFDVDHFKKINDNYGHPAGDEVLRVISGAVRETIRMEDLFGRYGGEEFVLIVRNIGHDEAFRVAQRLKTIIEKLVIYSDGIQIPVTISLGVATRTDGMDLNPENLLHIADKRLYSAKQRGRNQVVGEE